MRYLIQYSGNFVGCAAQEVVFLACRVCNFDVYSGKIDFPTCTKFSNKLSKNSIISSCTELSNKWSKFSIYARFSGCSIIPYMLVQPQTFRVVVVRLPTHLKSTRSSRKIRLSRTPYVAGRVYRDLFK